MQWGTGCSSRHSSRRYICISIEYTAPHQPVPQLTGGCDAACRRRLEPCSVELDVSPTCRVMCRCRRRTSIRCSGCNRRQWRRYSSSAWRLASWPMSEVRFGDILTRYRNLDAEVCFSRRIRCIRTVANALSHAMHCTRWRLHALTSGSAMAEGPRDALVSRNSATTKYRYRVALFAWSYV